MANGRHRARRARMTLAQRLGATAMLLGVTGFAAATWPATATADAPVQTAWWNAFSGGGQSAPGPLTPAGGLHVAVSSNQVLAFGALQYALATGSTATLELKVSNLAATPVINPTSPTTDPEAPIVACAITGSWQPGDDQPMASAPTFDCTHSVPGNLSADQKTLTFLVDSSLERLPGQLSVAIVPLLTNQIPGVGTPAPVDTTQPFSLDIAKPDVTSLTVTGAAALPPPPPITKPTTTGVGATGATSGSAAGTGSASSGMTLPSSVTSNTSTATDTGTAPVVASQNAVPNDAPAAATAPARSDRAHNAALAMLLLIGIGMAAMGSGQMQRAPRLLGGAGRHAAANAAVAPVPVPMTPYGNRGLGRFAKPRTEAARPLT